MRPAVIGIEGSMTGNDPGHRPVLAINRFTGIPQDLRVPMLLGHRGPRHAVPGATGTPAIYTREDMMRHQPILSRTGDDSVMTLNVPTAERGTTHDRASGLRRGWGGRARSRAVVVIVGVCALVGVAVAAAPAASANTPSDWSHQVSGTSITIGWTQDHAWLISDYSDVITQGSGYIAGQLCSVIVGEEMPGQPCSLAVRDLVGPLVNGVPALTNHGIWIAAYPQGWLPLRPTIG